MSLRVVLGFRWPALIGSKPTVFDATIEITLVTQPVILLGIMDVDFVELFW